MSPEYERLFRSRSAAPLFSGLVGLGAWPTAYPKYAIIDAGVFANQAHCDWLQWTAEGGIPLGISMVLLFAWALRLAWKTIWGLGIVSVLLHACVDYPFSRPALGSFFVVMLALLAAQTSKRRVVRPPQYGPEPSPRNIY